MAEQRTTSGELEWISASYALETSGMWPIKAYIQRRKDTIAAQVTCWSIYDLCTGAERIPVASGFLRWWDQDIGREVELPVDECSFKI